MSLQKPTDLLAFRLGLDPKFRINFQPGLSLPAQGEDHGPAILGETRHTSASRFDLPLRNPDQPTYLSDLETETTSNRSRPFASGVASEHLLDHRRVVDLPTRIPTEDRPDACAADAQHAGDIIGGCAPITRKQHIGGGFLPAVCHAIRKDGERRGAQNDLAALAVPPHRVAGREPACRADS